jgi:hypothetical protein
MKFFYPRSLSNGPELIYLILVLLTGSHAWAQAPTALTYPTPVVYIANVSNIFLSPNVSGSVNSYSMPASPALPAGVTFNTNTGVISGKATEAKVSTVYTVTATNALGSTNTNLTLTFTNNYLDNANNQVHFGGAGVIVSHPNGSATGKTAGDITLYRNVATISGQAIDCYVTTKSVTNVSSWDAYDQNATSGDLFNSNSPDFFSPQVNFGNNGGNIKFEFQFILAGTYNSTTKSGLNVVLQNVTLNTYDIDGNDDSGSNQFNEFGGFNTSALGSPNPTVAASYNATTGLTKFRSTTSSNTITVTEKTTRVRVTYTYLSDFTIVVGAEGDGPAYFFLDFSAGPAFTSTVTTSPSVDLNTSGPGVSNIESGCGTSLAFTKSSQTNIASPNALTKLDMSYVSSTILDATVAGLGEKLVISGATAGTGAHPLDFASSSSSTVTVGIGFNINKTVVTDEGVTTKTLSFTKTGGGTFTVAQAEALLDAFRYENTATIPTFGERRFKINVYNSTFKSPDADFYASITCVSISGHIYHDANGLLGTTDLGKVNATGPSQFTGNFAYAILVDPTNDRVLASRGIDAGGAFTFGKVTPGNYIIYVSNAAKTAGDPMTSASYPAGGYVPIGENLGAQAGNDLSIDGKLTFSVGTLPVTDANFGLQIPPTANDVTAAAQANPGGTQTVTVPTLNGLDAEDGTLQGGAGNTVKILTLPANAKLYYNGGEITLINTIITDYNPALLKIDPNDGALTATFKYSEIDAAGFISPEATVTMPFTEFAITGKVYHDINGIKNGLVDGTLINAADGTVLYVNLVEKATGLVKGWSALNAGAYSFNTTSGLQTNTVFDLVLSSVKGVIGTTMGATSILPDPWVSTAEGSGTGDGAPANGMLQVSVAASNINSGLDFGIEKIPVPGSGSNFVINPLGTVNLTVPANTFNNAMVSSDPDGTVTSIRITEFPAKVTSITIGAVTYRANVPEEVTALLELIMETDEDGTPTAVVKLDPSEEGPTSIDIPFKSIDNAGIESALTGHAVISSTPLPVTLVSFEAQTEGSVVQLSWATTEEVNSERFDVQHSRDAVSWKTVGHVTSHGESKVTQQYAFVHNTPSDGLNYYRLKMIDLDGTFAMSRMQSVRQDTKGSIFIYPNPVVDKLTITSSGRSIGSVEVLDLSGKKILETKSTADIPVDRFSIGAYMLKINFSDHSSEIRKFIINR